MPAATTQKGRRRRLRSQRQRFSRTMHFVCCGRTCRSKPYCCSSVSKQDRYYLFAAGGFRRRFGVPDAGGVDVVPSEGRNPVEGKVCLEAGLVLFVCSRRFPPKVRRTRRWRCGRGAERRSKSCRGQSLSPALDVVPTGVFDGYTTVTCAQGRNLTFGRQHIMQMYCPVSKDQTGGTSDVMSVVV